MRPFDRGSLLRKYVALLAGLIGGALLASGAVGAVLAYREAMSAVAALQRGQAQHTASEIATVLQRVRGNLRASVAKFGAQGTAGTGVLGIELASLLRHHAEIADLRWIAPDGRELLRLARYGLPPGADARGAAPPDELLRRARGDGEALGPV